MGFVIDLILGIFDFIVDVLLLRHLRGKAGHAPRSVADDAMAVAHFDYVTLVWIALVSVGLMFVLIFAFNVPVAWGIGIGLVVGAVWGCLKYFQLVRQE
ncbi:hypothetical protein HNP33_003286 [Comamonas odontotermitis]|uniref:Uncharacterized protein n=1 Tax=Comamonas odontotermitis TaxID=379895 RepID=A0ABR6RJ23_9BURK|nr:hypothetical protein [Comamonas odontotermitis]MBB6579176.1 hypothetical protein [Comamonas odontotermitis]